MTAYLTYRRYQMAALQSGQYNEGTMETFLGDPLLSSQVHTFAVLKAAAVTFTGVQSWSPTISATNLTGVPPTVTIQDCLDQSRFVAAGTTSQIPANQRRVQLTVQVEDVNDTWYVFQTVQGASC